MDSDSENEILISYSSIEEFSSESDSDDDSLDEVRAWCAVVILHFHRVPQDFYLLEIQE